MVASPENSPFHEGEHELQARFGVRDAMERIGRKVIRDFLPDQHRLFYPRLPFLVLGAADASGRPWATVVCGAPGFMHSPDDKTLLVERPLADGDPLREGFGVGTEVGALGIELPTRRRNRLTGTVSRSDERGFSIRVAQTFGNCPKYIQARELQFEPGAERAREQASERAGRLTGSQKRLIRAADTFFIATRAGSSAAASSGSADVSHRGGRPAFVRIEGDTTLLVPDFSGNRFFNTLGNIHVNPKTGLLFVDFSNGDLLYLTGTTRIVWDGPEVEDFEGAERAWRFELEESVLLPASFPLRGEVESVSPALDGTGSWTDYGD